MAFLDVFNPVPLVATSVSEDEMTEAVSLVLVPATFVDVSRRMHEATLAMGLVLHKLTFIAAPITALDDAATLPPVPAPLSGVPCPGLDLDGWSFDEREW